jgi:tRNA A-37 threonylcarbamoyl transferase component Bud32
VVEPTRSSLGNRYELRGLLATGGMGQVWRAHDGLLGRAVAVKVLRSEFTGDSLFRARFRAEAQHAAALSHPNIAAVYDYGEEQATDGSGECLAYLVMELVEGESLSALLARTGPLSPDQTLVVLRQTAAALAVAHTAGVVHRDVKPGNVLVREDGTVKITDFGIAWSAGSVPLTQTGQVVGTAAYLSPEQAAGSHATPASDVYSLGMVGYECLTGHKAFEGDNSVAVALRQLRDQPAPLPEDIPAGVRALIEHALVKDPAYRWPDGAAFAAAVDDVRAGRDLPPVEHSDTLSFWLVPGGPLDAGGADAGGTDRPAAQTGTGTAARAGAAQPRTVRAPPAVPVRQRVGRVLVLLAALLVGAGVSFAVLEQLDATGSPSGPPVAAAQLGGPAAVSGGSGMRVDAADYLGRPVDEVESELTARGLVVDTKPVVTDTPAPGVVLAVSPSGSQLARGDQVLVSYAVARHNDGRPGATGGRAPVESVLRPPAHTTAATSTPPPTTTGHTSAGVAGGGTDKSGAASGTRTSATPPTATTAGPTSSAGPTSGSSTSPTTGTGSTSAATDSGATDSGGEDGSDGSDGNGAWNTG